MPADIDAGESERFANGRGGELYQQYQDRLKAVNACDFGDLLLHMLVILKTHRDVLESYQERFRYIMVDEYQDTNSVQYLWLRLLAQARKNIACVGDDDQSIYSWRGAQVENILRFEKDFPGAVVIRLEQNYRSTPHILGAAGGVIAHNSGRLGKQLWTELDAGEKVRVLGVWDGPEEARRVGDEIENCRRGARAWTRSPSSSAPRTRRASSRTGSSRSVCPIVSSAASASTSVRKSAMRWPICGWSTSRPTIWRSSGLSTSRSAVWATRRWRRSTSWRAAKACR